VSFKLHSRARRGMTGLETAIILVAFVITAAAFAFVVLNMGFLTSQKTQAVISSSIQEASSSILLDGDVIAHFNVSSDQSRVNMTKIVFYIRLSQGKEPIDVSDSKLTLTYQNPRCHGEIYQTNGTVTTIYEVAGDGNTLLESGERFRIEINLNQLNSTMVDPPTTTRVDLYSHPYEYFRVEVRPSQGAVVSVERFIGAIYQEVVSIL